MDRGRLVATGLLATLLVATFVSHVTAAKSQKCEDARNTLPNNPDIKAFKQCAGEKPITAACCRKLLPFAQYYDCLSDPGYKAEVEQYLSGVTTIDEVQKGCLA